MFDIAFLLIFVTLAATILGTFWAERMAAKVAIAILAVTMAGGTVYETQETIQETRKAQRSLDLLIRAAQPTDLFLDAISASVRTISTQKGLSFSRVIRLSDGQTVIVFQEQRDSPISGAILLSKRILQDMFIKYAIDLELDVDLAPTNDDRQLISLVREWLEGHRYRNDSDLLYNIGYISRFALMSRGIAQSSTFSADYMGEGEEKGVIVSATKEQNVVGRVYFKPVFVKQLQNALPIERGRMIFEAALAGFTTTNG